MKNLSKFIALLLMCGSFAVHAKVTINEPWTRATVEGQQMGGAFLTLNNPDEKDAALIAVSSPMAMHTELHQMQNINGTMEMSAINKIDIPAHQTVVLAPKGSHIMFMGLKQSLNAGSKVPLVLTIQQNGKIKTIKVNATVRALGQ